MSFLDLDPAWARASGHPADVVLVRTAAGTPALWVQVTGGVPVLHDLHEVESPSVSPLGSLSRLRGVSGLASRVKEWLRLVDLAGCPTPKADIHPELRG